MPPGKGKDRRLELPYEFDGRVLDEFQRMAIMRLIQSTSTLVCAPTGTGKTLIADFLVAKSLGEGASVVYTGPIKALVSQKYREFARRFGKERVGIVTGDVTHRKEAPVVAMTTEVLRNILLAGEGPRGDVGWVILDEVHYLGHEARGAVWEEVVMLLPRTVRILGLSATAPNAAEIASWIERVRGEPVGLVEQKERAVPLEHLYFNGECRGVSREAYLKRWAEAVAPGEGGEARCHGSGAGARGPGGGGPVRSPGGRGPGAAKGYRQSSPLGATRDESSHLDLVEYVAERRLFPCLYFDFSRKGVAEKAEELAARRKPLSGRELEAVRVGVKRTLEEMGLTRDDVPDLERAEPLWQRGIGIHHAGLMPAVRRISERLLEARILRVVYATETFAVGVNLPVRSVCFDSLEKFDGKRFRLLTQQEYFQMAGRAGRRGLDDRGVAISLVPFHRFAASPPPEFSEENLEPIESSLAISYNLVASLVDRGIDARRFLSSSLAVHQAQDPGAALDRLAGEFAERLAVLERLGHVKNAALTAKGRLLTRLFVCELVVAELIDQGALDDYEPPDLAALAAAVALADDRLEPGGWRPKGTPRRDDRRGPGRTRLVPGRWVTDLHLAGERLGRLAGVTAPGAASWVAPEMVYRWCEGAPARELVKRLRVDGGDLVSACRRSIDLLRQIERAAEERPRLRARAREAIERMDRDVVKVIVG